MTSKFVENIPDAGRIVDTLRDTGYTLEGAVADIVDNSISAEATAVHIELDLDVTQQPFFAIIDNGNGMDEAGLINALKYGSQVQSNIHSLSKFGIGLKTASTAFAKRLCVISRGQSDGTVRKAVNDLNVIAKEGQFLTEITEPTDYDVKHLDSVAKGGSGTLVVWEEIDNLVLHLDETEEQVKTSTLKGRMTRNKNDVLDHIAMTFYRFLDPSDDRVPTVEITLNSTKIAPWDPFCRDEEGDKTSGTVRMTKEVSLSLSDGTKSSFTLHSSILPRPEDFSSKERRLEAKVGIGTKATKFQGIYVFRENRMISGPDWLGIWAVEPHQNLLRVDLSFDADFDRLFSVDFKKSRILLNGKIQSAIEGYLGGPRRAAQDRQRKGANKVASAENINASSKKIIGEHSVKGTLVQPKVLSVDKKTSMVNLLNNSGKEQLQLKIETKPDEMQIDEQEKLLDGVLWEPGILNNEVSVVLNTDHPYYRKTWYLHKENTNIIQSLNFLLWSLAQAETNNTVGDNQDLFRLFRYEVSKNLIKLIENHPEPEEV